MAYLPNSCALSVAVKLSQYLWHVLSAFRPKDTVPQILTNYICVLVSPYYCWDCLTFWFGFCPFNGFLGIAPLAADACTLYFALWASSSAVYSSIYIFFFRFFRVQGFRIWDIRLGGGLGFRVLGFRV
jgi:hypothetical protein